MFALQPGKGKLSHDADIIMASFENKASVFIEYMDMQKIQDI